MQQLRAQIDLHNERRERAERRLDEQRQILAETKNELHDSKRSNNHLRAEIDALEAQSAQRLQTASGPKRSLNELTVLYVGGQPSQMPTVRALVEQMDGRFLHHDGGLEERGGLLPGLVNRSDVVVFPVDCICHDAALSLKRLCRQVGRPFLPLRSAGLSSLVLALYQLDLGHSNAEIRA